ncbi:MAG: Uma2 family endonuclease [Chloroflexota bacterium]
MAVSLRFTSADLEVLPQDDRRYEIIDGELYVSRQPSFVHQVACSRANWALEDWNLRTSAGVTIYAPGLIFADDDDVAPDVVWASHERLPAILGQDGKLHGPPELVIEVLSPGAANERRDRDTKLRLYSRRGVDEYWIIDPQQRLVGVFRHQQGALQPVATLREPDDLSSPLLPGFSCPVRLLFAQQP